MFRRAVAFETEIHKLKDFNPIVSDESWQIVLKNGIFFIDMTSGTLPCR